jgi:hypothetical protein
MRVRRVAVLWAGPVGSTPRGCSNRAACAVTVHEQGEPDDLGSASASQARSAS